MDVVGGKRNQKRKARESYESVSFIPAACVNAKRHLGGKFATK